MKLIEDLIKIITTKDFINYLLMGFSNTLIITICAAFLGLIIGFSIAVIKIIGKDNPKWKIPGIICEIYTTIIRGTPVALQLFIMVFQIFIIENVDLQTIAIIVTFGINSGAYVSESIRAGIESVDIGQMEAGRALGLTQFTTMRKIVLPQAIKNVIPAIGNELIALLKETSIVSMVGATIGTLTFDLTEASNLISIKIGGNYFVPTLIAGCFYLLIVYLITFIIKKIERRMKLSDKR